MILEGVAWRKIEGKTLKLNTAKDVESYCKDIKDTVGLEEICLSGNSFGVEACEAIALALQAHDLKSVFFNDMFTGRLKDEIPLALEAFVRVLVKMVLLI